MLVALAVYVFLPHLPSFDDSLDTLRDADYTYVGLGVLFWLSTFFSAAFVYKFIALKPLRYSTTLLVQFASGFANRLAPMGAGIITLNIGYLIKRGHSAAQAGAVVALNNLLGFVGVAILLLATAVLSPSSLKNSFKPDVHVSTVWAIVIAACLLTAVWLSVVFGVKLIQKIKKAVQSVIRNAVRNPFRILLALLASMTITVGYTAALYAVGLAFNVHVTIAQTLLVLTLGVVAASATPTPGGIGGAEVGLVAALISVGVFPHQALTTALMYRFITYWLPIVPGFICLQIALRRRYL